MNPDRKDLDITQSLLADIGCEKDSYSLVNDYAQRLVFADRHFDLIWSISVIEHIPEPFDGMALQNLWRMLRPDGLLVLTVPAAAKGGDHYRECDVYALEGGGVQRTQKGIFFQRAYDHAMVREGLLGQLPGAKVEDSQIWGEATRGAFDAYAERWVLRGEQETCRDPYMMATLFRRFASLQELPGTGVLCLALRKGA